MDRPPTLRLWEAEPGRKTALATVTAVRGVAFTLDRSLFRPKGTAYRHHQNADRGMVWVQGGDKQRLSAVYERWGDLWHHSSGERPKVGDRLQCHLDQVRRDRDSRTHTGMHLMLRAIQAGDGPALLTDPEVKGGGRFRLDLATSYVAPKTLAEWLARANQGVEADIPIERVVAPRNEVERVCTPQRFQVPDPFPGPAEVVSAVRLGKVCTYPCDGTHVDRTSQVGRMILRQAQPDGRGGFMVIGEVPRR